MAPWATVGEAGGRSPAAPGGLALRLAAAPDDVLAAIRAERLDKAPLEGLAGRLVPVDALLDRTPDLGAIVRGVVRVVHPLSAQPGYDVSHSQPVWPDRIFVSFPERADETGDLRLAESVLHEAMHLLLTEEEGVRPLVDRTTAELWSPWMGTARGAGGVLHGLFVFLCINGFLGRLAAEPGIGPDALRHCRRRAEQIASEIAQLDREALLRALTPWGRSRIDVWSRSMGC